MSAIKTLVFVSICLIIGLWIGVGADLMLAQHPYLDYRSAAVNMALGVAVVVSGIAAVILVWKLFR